VPKHAPTQQKSSCAAAFAQRHWQYNGWLAKLLSPLAAAAGWHIKRRQRQYQTGIRTAYRAPVPVIVIGNIYVGGTGKTPVVIATVHALRERGWTPGVISRGYGAKIGETALIGLGELDPTRFGDEPALIAHATQAPIAVHPRRALAVQALLEQYPQIDVIISDDGLQHLALARDVEFIVQDERGIGNGKLLPAGPLREPASRLNMADVVVTNRSANTTSQNTTRASTHPSTGRPRYTDMQLVPKIVEQTTSRIQRPLSDFHYTGPFQTVAAAAGIGNPTRFFDTLRAAGIQPAPCLALPDHYDYQQSPFTTIQADAILITSKDAIKCRRFQDDRLWEVSVNAQFSDPVLFDWLDQHLQQFCRT
jgi:tetraacyldisaccharide 4'-kinase